MPETAPVVDIATHAYIKIKQSFHEPDNPMNASSLTVTPTLIKMARRLAQVATILAWLIPLLVAAQFALGHSVLAEPAYAKEAVFAAVEWTTQRLLIAAMVNLLPGIALMIVLLLLARICREYAEGRLFSPVVIRAYRRMGFALVGVTLLHWLQPTILGLALAITLPAGKRFLYVGVSSDDLLLTLVTAVVFLLGSVMQIAQNIQADNAEIV